MTASEPLPSSRRQPAALRLLLPFAALALVLSPVLSACAEGGPATEPTDQETAVQSSTPEPSSIPLPTETGAQATPPTAEAPPAASGTSALLTISIRQDASAEPVQYVLECVAGVPGPASTLPGAEAACAALARLGPRFFTAKPDKDVICTQQYGGPQTASIAGELDGTPVLASFALTDGCEISRWNSARDILGAPGAQ